MNDKEIIKKNLEKMLSNQFLIKSSEDIYNKSLLDPKFGLQPRDLLKLFFECEREYNIKFTQDDVIDKRFDYIDNIVDSIYKKILNKELRDNCD